MTYVAEAHATRFTQETAPAFFETDTEVMMRETAQAIMSILATTTAEERRGCWKVGWWTWLTSSPLRAACRWRAMYRKPIIDCLQKGISRPEFTRETACGMQDAGCSRLLSTLLFMQGGVVWVWYGQKQPAGTL